MDKVLTKAFAVVTFLLVSANVYADARTYIDEQGCERYEYVKGWQDPNLVISEKDWKAFQELERRLVSERSIERIGKKNGLTDFEIHDLKKELLKEK